MDIASDAVVIGAGVIGLAVGRALAQAGLETVVLERGTVIGAETSSRNSGVIHAGIYYPPGSLKATTCVRGKALLYGFLESHKVPYSRCGKLIVAAGSDALAALTTILERAQRCGVADLELLDGAAIRLLEPNVRAAFGLLSPSTGIVDAHQLMLALQGDLESAGGSLVLSASLESGALSRSGLHRLRVGGQMTAEIGCRVVVNATGLHARDTWKRLTGSDASAPPQYFAKGHYYAYSGPAPFTRLVYPLPEAGGLGVHATLDLGGQVRFGPDVRWVDTLDYGFDDSRRQGFVDAIRAWYPAVENDRLRPGYTGIRPKLVGAGEPGGDFTMLTVADHGYPGFCSLHGIESPGLTACLAIAERVVAAVLD